MRPSSGDSAPAKNAKPIDYYPLLANALATLDVNTAETRSALFELALAREVAWEQGDALLRALGWLGTLLGAVAVAQVLGLDPIYGADAPRVAVATFGNSNAFAAFAAMGLLVYRPNARTTGESAGT